MNNMKRMKVLNKFLVVYGNSAWTEEILVWAYSALEARSIVSSELRPYVKLFSCKML